MQGKVAVVTGSSRGIGKGLALDLAGEGANVVVVGRTETEGTSRLPGTIHETVEEVKALGKGNAIAVRCDVTKQEDVESLVKQTMDAFGRIDVLINNAGGSSSRSATMDIPVYRWYNVMNLNVNAVFMCCKFMLPHMISQGSGSIINVSSGAATGSSVQSSAYSTSKAALEIFSVVLAREVGPQGISVVAYRPGRIKTEGAVYVNPKDTDWSPWGDLHSCGPSIIWLAQQTPETFTGQVVDRADFGKTWGLNG